MSHDAIFSSWRQTDTALWGNQPISITHRLHESPLFAQEQLAALVESYPRQHYSIIHMGAQGTNHHFWREGDLGGLSGREVIEAIAKGRLWLNLRQLNVVDRRYGDMLEAMFDELHQNIPGLATYRHGCGILISSPKAQVYYHADLPGQMLFQISGRKRIYFYPPQKPFLAPENLEHIAVSGLEVDIPYSEWYDEYARVYELEPGKMVHWPHTAPHRIENHDCLNISMTVEYSTDTIRRAYIVNYANGILRYGLGWTPRSRSISGPSFWTKAVLQRSLRNASWMRKKKASNRQIQFKLDRMSPGAIVELSNP